MKTYCRIAVLFLLSTMASTQFVSAANRTGLTKEEIKALPIEDRPNRLGHFYGRSVRRAAGVVGWQLISIKDKESGEQGVVPNAESIPTPAR